MAGVVKYHGTAQVDHPPPLDPYACVCYSAYTSSKGVWTRIGVCLLRGRILGTANRPRSIVLVPIHQAPKSGPLGPSREKNYPRHSTLQEYNLLPSAHPPSYPRSGTLQPLAVLKLVPGVTMLL